MALPLNDCIGRLAMSYARIKKGLHYLAVM